MAPSWPLKTYSLATHSVQIVTIFNSVIGLLSGIHLYMLNWSERYQDRKMEVVLSHEPGGMSNSHHRHQGLCKASDTAAY